MFFVYKWWFHWISSKHSFLLIHKIVPLSGRDKLYIPISGTNIYPISRFLTLLRFSLVSFHQELESFWKTKIYLIDWYRISPSSKGCSHHDYVDSGHGRVRKFGGRAANLCWLSDDTLTNLELYLISGRAELFQADHCVQGSRRTSCFPSSSVTGTF